MKEDRPRGIRVRECGKVRSSDQDSGWRRARNEGQSSQPGKEGGIKPARVSGGGMMETGTLDG